jgi:hypothetical protein
MHCDSPGCCHNGDGRGMFMLALDNAAILSQVARNFRYAIIARFWDRETA